MTVEDTYGWNVQAGVSGTCINLVKNVVHPHTMYKAKNTLKSIVFQTQ